MLPQREMGFAAVYASSVLVQLVLCFWDHLFVVILDQKSPAAVPQLQEPEPVDWAMEKVSDDEDDAPIPDLIDMPPARGIRTSHVEPGALHRSAARVWLWSTMSLAKKNMSHMTIVTCVLFSCAIVFVLRVFVLCVLPRIPWLQKRVFFLGFLGRW